MPVEYARMKQGTDICSIQNDNSDDQARAECTRGPTETGEDDQVPRLDLWLVDSFINEMSAQATCSAQQYTQPMPNSTEIRYCYNSGADLTNSVQPQIAKVQWGLFN